jgi:16S rRNA processing protein RimM
LKSEVKNQNLTLIGHCRGARGLAGELRIYVSSQEANWNGKVKSISLETPTGLKHFAVVSLKEQMPEVWIRVSEITNKEDADLLKGSKAYIDAKHFVAQKQDNYFLSELQGFQVLDKDVAIGVVVGFETNNAQDLVVIEKDSKKFLIPLIKPFLIKINDKEKTILMDLPEGLLEDENAF